MEVRVIEARHNELPFEINNRGLAVFVLLDVIIRADGQNSIPFDGECLCSADAVSMLHACPDVSIDEDCVGSGTTPIC
jgi:hypothetical protein